MQPVTGQYDDSDESSHDDSQELRVHKSIKDISREELVKLHGKIIKRFDIAKAAWSDPHTEYVKDIKFGGGEQWDPSVVTDRTAANLSSLTYNTIPAKSKFITNNARRGLPGIKVNPAGDGATNNTARVLEGTIRYMQLKYNAKSAYLHAYTGAVEGGLGACRMEPLELATGEFDICTKRILDPTTVYMDPSAVNADFSDAEYVFISTWLQKEDVEERFGDNVSGFSDSIRSSMWTQEQVQVLEYWCINADTGKAEQYLLSGDRILSLNRAYRGEKLPVLLLTGDEQVIEGRRVFKGIVRDIKDIQTLLNLTKSQTADWIGRASQQQWMFTPAQIRGFESIWLSPNLNGAAGLPYNPGPDGPPVRLDAPAPPAGYMQVSAEADADIRASVGIRDPLEQLPANISNKTLNLQVSQSNIGTYQFVDKLKDFLKLCGDVYLDLIKGYLSYAHIREIMGVDGQIQAVQVNQAYEENGQTVLHDLTKGRYIAIVSDSPSYESQRAEASEKLLEIAKVHPPLMQMGADIVYRNMEFPGSEELADRARAMIPPNILAASSSSNADGSGANQGQIAQNQLQQAQQQMQQLQMQNQQLHQLLQQAQQEQQTKAQEVQVKTQAELTLEQVRHQNAMELEQLKLTGKLKLDAQGQSADMRREVLRGHTDVFKAELQHNAANVTPLDDVPVHDIDPALQLMTDISDEVSLPDAFAPTTELTTAPTQEIV